MIHCIVKIMHDSYTNRQREEERWGVNRKREANGDLFSPLKALNVLLCFSVYINLNYFIRQHRFESRSRASHIECCCRRTTSIHLENSCFHSVFSSSYPSMHWLVLSHTECNFVNAHQKKNAPHKIKTQTDMIF